MSAAIVEEPRLLHALPGRVRVHLPGWAGQGQRQLELRLREVRGVRSAQANVVTGNVLVQFDPATTNEQAILAVVRSLDLGPTGPPEAPAPPPPVLRERRGALCRARIPVRGLDRDPHLVGRIVDHLAALPGVTRVQASPLTGRVLVEFAAETVTVADLLAEIAGLELPPLPEEDHPAHPLDPSPLVRSLTRTAGAALGLGLLAARRALGAAGPPAGGPAPAVIADVIGIAQSFPGLRNGLRRLLGEHPADLLFSGAGIASLTLAGSPLGLALAGAEGARLATEALERRAAWRRYEERIEPVTPAHPGAVIRLETGERTPLAGAVLEGTGAATGRDGLPVPVAPGARLTAGMRLYGGPFAVRLRGDVPFVPLPRPAPVARTRYERYLRGVGPLALAYVALTAVVTRSLPRTFQALLLVNPRAAVVGAEAANLGAAARVARQGVTIVGTRPDRIVRRPDALLLDGARVLTDGLELAAVVPLREDDDAADLLARAAGVAAAAGSPWGGAFRGVRGAAATAGGFDGRVAAASIDGVPHSLGPVGEGEVVPAAFRLRHRGDYLLLLRGGPARRPLGLLVFRPRLAAGVAALVEACQRHRVELALLPAGDPLVTQLVAQRARVPLLAPGDMVAAVRARQAAGAVVALVSDSAQAAPAFAACDLAIGLTSGRTSRFPARADLLAPDLGGVAAIVEAGARREAAVRDAVALAVGANACGAVWGLLRRPAMLQAPQIAQVAALAALGVSWLRLRGGERPRDLLLSLVDPRPERWGRRSVSSVLRDLRTSERGLTSAEAAERRIAAPRPAGRNRLLAAVVDQLRSPLTGILAAGAILSLMLGATADVAMIGAVIVANAAISAWQEHQASQAAKVLEALGPVAARVLRDGRSTTIAAHEVVPGDILLLAPGDRVAADARLLSAQSLEVDEAALTGESLPAPKSPSGGTEASRIVLEGSDVTVGTGRAVVVAVGPRTRWGATAAALAVDQSAQTPLGTRLHRLLHQALPVIAAGGATVTAAGLFWRRPPLQQLAIGASVAIAAVPEGLPLLAGTVSAAVARRLTEQRAFVRRLSAIEALGRVDIACTDKTGTLTEGRLSLRLVADHEREARLPGPLPPGVRQVLLTAALASPHPDAADAAAHPTDVAITRGAGAAGLADALREARIAELPFDPARSFHAAVVAGRLCVKGAAEVVVPRCRRLWRHGEDQPLDEVGRRALLARAERLAARGLRVLMVAEGAADQPPDRAEDLVALGFVGISDPLRPSVPAALRRCHEAGIRVIMLTGDHPATARAIAREAGFLHDGEAVLTGAEIAELSNGELDRLLEDAVVIARITPLDKLRIVESLQRRGHTVAMTGDGVNDAPALRLADVGVAMGRGGTEVARQAADLVLADDDFATLVEALVEGRGFWRNIRRALGLLLGGNLGELGLMVGASVLSPAIPLTSRQILAINLVTDVLPSLAVGLQPPAQRHLAALAREGTTALEGPLRDDVLRRATATALPSLAAYLAALAGRMPGAGTVAFAGLVATQLAQTLSMGWAEGRLDRAVLGAVAASSALLLAALTMPPLRGFLGLVTPTPAGWLLIGAAALGAVLIDRAMASPGIPGPARLPQVAAAAPA